MNNLIHKKIKKSKFKGKKKEFGIVHSSIKLLDPCLLAYVIDFIFHQENSPKERP